MIDFIFGWCVIGVLQLFFGLLCYAIADDSGPESKAGQTIWVLVGGPVVWLVFGIVYLAILKEERETKHER